MLYQVERSNDMKNDESVRQAGAAMPRGVDESTPIGFVTVTQVIKHTEAVYPGRDFSTYGQAIDDYVRDLFRDNPAMVIQNLELEISDEAAAALRDRCNRGEY
jgi:hypothetical protein